MTAVYFKHSHNISAFHFCFDFRHSIVRISSVLWVIPTDSNSALTIKWSFSRKKTSKIQSNWSDRLRFGSVCFLAFPHKHEVCALYIAYRFCGKKVSLARFFTLDLATGDLISDQVIDEPFWSTNWTYEFAVHKHENMCVYDEHFCSALNSEIINKKKKKNLLESSSCRFSSLSTVTLKCSWFHDFDLISIVRKMNSSEESVGRKYATDTLKR